MGRFFRMDPMVALKSNYFEWAVRKVAFEVAVEQQERAVAEANKQK